MRCQQVLSASPAGKIEELEKAQAATSSSHEKESLKSRKKGLREVTKFCRCLALHPYMPMLLPVLLVWFSFLFPFSLPFMSTLWPSSGPQGLPLALAGLSSATTAC
jgi:hypothetical protein